MSWRNTLTNFLIFLSVLRIMLFDTQHKPVLQARAQRGLKGGLPIITVWRTDIQYLTPSIPEIDWPFPRPPNLTYCGPIVLDAPHLHEVDPEWHTWIERAPTVLICLGSHFRWGNQAFYGVLQGLIAGLPDGVQVIWKYPGLKDQERKEYLENSLKGAKLLERVRVVEWLEPEPISIVQHRNLVASVHHGGANSFFEACL